MFARLLFVSAFAVGLAAPVSVSADTIATLPAADGVHRDFGTSSGTTHYSLLSADCNPTKYTYSTAAGAADSYRLNLSSVPLGATITTIEITPCAASYSGASSQIQTFYVVNGVTSAAAGRYDLPGGAPAVSAATVFGGLSVLRVAGGTLEAGVSVSGGTGGVKLSGLTVRITYTPPESFVAPTNLTAAYRSSSEIRLSWTDNTTTETGFRIERSQNGTSGWGLVRYVAANTTAYADTGLTPDQTYYYRLQTINTVTGQASPFSSTVNATTYASVPAAPRNLWGMVSPSSITLSWMRLSNNDDGTAIERSTDAVSFTEIARTPPGASTFTDSVSTSGRSFFYRARSFNVLGYSAYSNTASNSAASTSGPDLRVALQSQQTSGGRSQTTRFTVSYSNAGTLQSENAYLTTAVPSNATFDVASSSPEWRCHNPAADAFKLQVDIGKVLRAFRVRYPNLQQVFISSHMYAGYASAPASLVEPFGFEGGFAVKAAIEAQIQQARSGVIDPLTGDMDYRSGTAPWMAWGPYYWANGMTPNGQGLFFEIADFASDLSHPSDPVGRTKLANLMLNNLLSSPYTSWIRVQDADAIPILPVAQPPPSPTPLLDMLAGQLYLGLPGGLYPNDSNALPDDHLAAGMDAAARIQPLDSMGFPSSAGKVLFISIGYSNGKQIFDTFIPMASADPRMKPQNDQRHASASLRIVNGALGGGVARSWSDPTLTNFETVKTLLADWGYTENQVQAIWFNAGNAATPLNAVSLLGTAAGTACFLPLGALATNAGGSTIFTVRTAFSNPQPISLLVNALDDGRAGADLWPPDNSAQATLTVVP